jgi:hypothetical protein
VSFASGLHGIIIPTIFYLPMLLHELGWEDTGPTSFSGYVSWNFTLGLYWLWLIWPCIQIWGRAPGERLFSLGFSLGLTGWLLSSPLMLMLTVLMTGGHI